MALTVKVWAPMVRMSPTCRELVNVVVVPTTAFDPWVTATVPVMVGEAPATMSV